MTAAELERIWLSDLRLTEEAHTVTRTNEEVAFDFIMWWLSQRGRTLRVGLAPMDYIKPAIPNLVLAFAVGSRRSHSCTASTIEQSLFGSWAAK